MPAGSPARRAKLVELPVVDPSSWRSKFDRLTDPAKAATIGRRSHWKGAVLDRLPERPLLDILARTAHLTGWHHRFGPASGSDPKIKPEERTWALCADGWPT
ncbi:MULTISPECIES: hypothetical protein [unclassified Nonomuraea]|uniref:hypothetical protein n=1 Tax=unclassified Nonomuraea TaxID=2593643 RepID=UPI003402CC30